MSSPIPFHLGTPLLLALGACGSTWDLAPRLVPKNLPEMPAAAELDYTPLRGMAHAALPLFDAQQGGFRGDGRVWLKGSSALPNARLGATGRTVVLAPPYYTAVVDAPAGEVEVQFLDGSQRAARTVHVDVPDAAALNRPGAPFAALFFGDFQPFVVADGRVQVNAGDDIDRDDRGGAGALPPTTLVALRAMFERAARGELASFPRPAFACGVGDQVYVEGDYHSWDEHEHRHPMSAWTIDAQPRPRVGVADLPRFLDTCYRGGWSFPPFERALQACPAVMTWDDHDIRDGWGSQGDEHVYRDSYFPPFRAAYVEHQVRRGPRALAGDAERLDAPLWQAFAVNGVPTFVLDLRTCRDIAVPQVIGDEQWRALRAWFTSLDAQRCRHYVLVSSVPLFFRVAERASIAAAFTDEARDDLLDTWNSEPNEPEWRQLVDLVADAGARGLRGLVVSGDYHVNSLCRVTAQRGDGPPRTIAYELIASGLAADGFSDWKQKMAREGWFVETPFAAGPDTLRTEFSFAEPCPSFGGLEFAGDQVIAHVFSASDAGCFHQRMPLSWEVGEQSLAAAAAAARVRIDTPARPR